MGLYDQSLRNLLDPVIWSGLGIDNYAVWAHAVWNILALRAIRRQVSNLQSSDQSLLSLFSEGRGGYMRKSSFLRSLLVRMI